MTDRDEQIDKALRDLEVPEHAPGFHASLRAELERARPSRRRRSLLAPRWGLGLAAAAVALIALFVGIRGPGGSEVGPQPASAARIAKAMSRALRQVESLQGILVVRDTYGGGHTVRWSFALAANGDFLQRQLPDDGALAYDASSGVETSGAEGSEPSVYGLRRGLAPGAPDEGPSDFLLQRDFGAVTRALLADPDTTVREGRYRGRDVWILDLNRGLHLVVPEEPGDRVRVTVDRRTFLPVRILETLRGELVGEIAISQLRVDSAGAADFKVSIPPGSRADRSDVGFRHMPLERAQAIVGYAPLVPGRLPEGYRRAETAVARTTSPTAQGGNPISRRVVSTAYRRGLDRFIVTTRLVGEDPSVWIDPIFINETVRATPEPVPFEEGALAGRTGRVIVSPGVTPHLWALTDRLVVTVSGDLTRAELVEVARSLGPLG